MKHAIPSSEDELKRICAEAGVSLPYSQVVSLLCAPVPVGRRMAPSRILYQPMEGCDAAEDGSPGELTRRRYLRFAAGGPGGIWFEATAVTDDGRANPRQLRISDGNVGEFARLVEEIKETAYRSGFPEPLVIMQATHSGRYSKPEGSPAPLVAYRNDALEKNGGAVKVVDDGYLDGVLDALVEAARLAERAGFDGVDIKSCHGYLLCELLSARDRTGRFGGGYENRTRLLLSAVRGARQTAKRDLIVASRVNVYDGADIPDGFGVAPDGSFDPAEPSQLAADLYAAGADLIDVTMGNPYFNPHVNRPFVTGGYEPPEHPAAGVARLLDGAAAVKKSAPGAAVACSGLSYLGVTAPNVAEAYVESGKIDLAGFGRQTLAYPDLAADIAAGGMKSSKTCLCCSKCTEIMRKPGGTPGCAARDREVYLPIYRKLCSEENR